MCGIIGYTPIGGSPFFGTIAWQEEIKQGFARLMRESRVRGMHAYGIGTDCQVYRSFDLDKVIQQFDPLKPTVAHCRYSTSGDYHVMENNQPIMPTGLGMVLAFNGVIHMGTKAEFEQAFGVQCETANDGEVFLRQLAQGHPAGDVIASYYGSFAGVWLRHGQLRAARNSRRPLWATLAYGARWYASTADIFRRAGFQSELVEVGPV